MPSIITSETCRGLEFLDLRNDPWAFGDRLRGGRPAEGDPGDLT